MVPVDWNSHIRTPRDAAARKRWSTIESNDADAVSLTALKHDSQRYLLLNFLLLMATFRFPNQR